MDINIVQSQQMENFRSIGDSIADDFIKEFVQQHGHKSLREIMPYLSDYRKLAKLPSEFGMVNDFIQNQSTLPEWSDSKEIIRACEFYSKYQMEIGMILGFYALPYCYLGANGAEVLVMTNRIKTDTLKRLKETGSFLQAILNIDNWKNGYAPVVLNKVRLLHACVRAFITHSGKWNSKFGTPVNQEDMSGTNLAFSLIVLRGLRKTGIMFDHYYERSYIHFWKVAGYFLGINEQLLINNMKEALLLDQHIALRQFKKSKAGIELTHSLMNCFSGLTSSTFESEIILAQTRYFLGARYADMLEIPKTKIPEVLLKTYNYSSSFVANIYK